MVAENSSVCTGVSAFFGTFCSIAYQSDQLRARTQAAHRKNEFDVLLEPHVEHLVGLVQHHVLNLVQLQRALLQQILFAAAIVSFCTE